MVGDVDPEALGKGKFMAEISFPYLLLCYAPAPSSLGACTDPGNPEVKNPTSSPQFLPLWIQ